MDIFKVILSNGKTIIFGNTETYENNDDFILSDQFIHLDDSIQTIKNKIIIALNYEYSYDEIYLFSNRDVEISKIDLYLSLNDSNENISKENFENFMNNVVDFEFEKKTHYTYDDILNLPNILDMYTFIGYKFQNESNHLLSIDPRKIKTMIDSSIYVSDNSLLLNFITKNNSIQLVLAEDILDIKFKSEINKKYLIDTYFPYLSKKNIYSIGDLIKNKESLKKSTKSNISNDLKKIYKLVDYFYKIYDATS